MLQQSGATVTGLCKQNHCRQRDRGCQQQMQPHCSSGSSPTPSNKPPTPSNKPPSPLLSWSGPPSASTCPAARAAVLTYFLYRLRLFWNHDCAKTGVSIHLFIHPLINLLIHAYNVSTHLLIGISRVHRRTYFNSFLNNPSKQTLAVRHCSKRVVGRYNMYNGGHSIFFVLDYCTTRNIGVRLNAARRGHHI